MMCSDEQQRPRPPREVLVTSAWGQLLMSWDGSVMNVSIATVTKDAATLTWATSGIEGATWPTA
jgi:hypothetical protein